MKYNYEMLENHFQIVFDLEESNKKKYVDNYINFIPESLFRFRKCVDKNFDSLENDYVWVAKAAGFGDVDDSRLHFDFKKQKNEILKAFDDIVPLIMNIEVPKILRKKGINIDAYGFNVEMLKDYKNEMTNKNGSPSKKKFNGYLKQRGLNNQKILQLNNILGKYFEKEFYEHLANITYDKIAELLNDIRSNIYVTCFSERINNKTLWDIYADKYKGFCIEYDIRSFLSVSKTDKILMLTPVIYKRKKPIDFVSILKLGVMEKYKEDIKFKEVSLKQLNVEGNIQIRTKSPGYSFEKEWRIAIDGKNINQKHHFPFIRAIYMGYLIDLKDKERLIGIAKKNNVVLYQQYFNNLSGRFSYENVNLTD